MKLLVISIFLLSLTNLNAQLSKKQVTENINKWYANHPDKYKLNLEGKEVKAEITRYHPEREDEQNDIIKVHYKGMEIELKFSRPITEISTHKDSLQKYFTYVSLFKIYHQIPSNGWDICPRTGQSSLNGTGVVFIEGGYSISLTINWSTFSVFGYRKTKNCYDELCIADGSVSEDCYVSVRKDLPLEISIKNVYLH